MARRQRKTADPLDRQAPIIDGFSLNDLVEPRTEGVIAQNTNGNRHFRRRRMPSLGQSMNLVKFRRKAAFTWYSEGGCAAPRAG